jgi:hypothetical protein
MIEHFFRGLGFNAAEDADARFDAVPLAAL